MVNIEKYSTAKRPLFIVSYISPIRNKIFSVIEQLHYTEMKVCSLDRESLHKLGSRNVLTLENSLYANPKLCNFRDIMSQVHIIIIIIIMSTALYLALADFQFLHPTHSR
jgi:hypothetical protein